MKTQAALTRIHRALGWSMLLLLPAQLLTGLWAMGKLGGEAGGLAGALHVGPWAALALGLMVITHGLLGIRFTVMKKMGGRAGALFLAAVWAAFLIILAIITL
jgi:succinate dehydrogenase/fumarate reductase cytochrome b subunit